MKISLFITCLIDTFFPRVGVSMVRLLRRLGVDVDFPSAQTCCGQPAFNSGFNEVAKDAAVQLLRAFSDSDAVVTPSGSCAAMIRRYYPTLFARTTWEAEARALAAKTFELSEFIVDQLGRVDLGGVHRATVVYHRSCHMTRGLEVTSAPVSLLRHIRKLNLIDLPHANECCGFGGTFAVKMPGVSTAMADDKLDHVGETEARLIVGSDMACLMHLGGRINKRGLPFEVMHLAELLDVATASVEGQKMGASHRGEDG